MGKVVNFTGERELPKQDNAGLAQYLREMADAIEKGEYGDLSLSTLVLVDNNGKVRQYHQMTRHYTNTEAIGVYAICQNQIITNEYELDDEA